jgi:hypothetical protein
MAVAVSSVPLSETHIAGPAAPGDDDLELTYDPQAGQRGVGDQRAADAVPKSPPRPSTGGLRI